MPGILSMPVCCRAASNGRLRLADTVWTGCEEILPALQECGDIFGQATPHKQAMMTGAVLQAPWQYRATPGAMHLPRQVPPACILMPAGMGWRLLPGIWA